MTLFERLGHDRLRAVIERFYDRMFADAMIGFLFAGKDRATLVQREWEFTARLLGAKLHYSGRPLPEAHRGSPIMGGHFDRRLQILREVLAEFAVPGEVQAAWIDHTEAMRHLVTKDALGQCTDQTAAPTATTAPAATTASAAATASPSPKRLKIVPSD